MILTEKIGEFPCVVLFLSLAFYAFVMIENFVKTEFAWYSFGFGCLGWICFLGFTLIYYRKGVKAVKRDIESWTAKFMGIAIAMIAVILNTGEQKQMELAVTLCTSAFAISGNAYPVIYVKLYFSEEIWISDS
jgi:hypothetical protein